MTNTIKTSNKKLHALLQLLDLPKEEQQELIEQYENVDTNDFETSEGDYMVLTEEETDDAVDENLENYIEECILPELPEAYKNYFDYAGWKKDAEMDGAGHILNSYDGSMEEVKIGEDWFNIFRTN